MRNSTNACQNACLLNAIAGLGDDDVLEAFCGNAGAGVPGLIYPLPIDFSVPAATVAAAPAQLEIAPKNNNGAVPFALLIDTSISADIAIVSIKDGAGDLAGLKGDGISTTWQIESFQDAERIFAGLPNLPPNLGAIDASHPLIIELTNADTVDPQSFPATLFVVIPKSKVLKN